VQQELFRIALSDNNKYVISISMNALVEWSQEEKQPQIKRAIIEYYNQLVALLEEDNGSNGN
jgi:hypothetical protein